jgi:predicted negative regulator of RcsB-dependent stress response
MAFDLEEQEQLDALKQFWKQYGGMIIAAVVAAVVTVAAVQGWRYYQRATAEDASALFMKLEEASRKNDVGEVRKLGGEIVDKYESGDPAAAAGQLQWVIDNADDQETAAFARLRLAGLRLDEKKYDEALKLLDTKHGEALVPLFADLRGDVLVAQGKVAEARAAYQQAIEKSEPGSNYRNVVQIKLDALGPGK